MSNYRFGSQSVIVIVGLTIFFGSMAVARADFSFSVGDYSATGLGNNGQSDFDKLTLTGRSGTFSLAVGSTTTITLSDLLFETGSFTPIGTLDYTMSQSLSVDGIVGSISQAYTVDSSAQDTLTIQDGDLSSSS